jgi:hypothetical protein
MKYSETGDPIGDLMYKLVIVFVSILIMIYFFPVALGTFGIFSCAGCDSLVVAFGIVFLSLAAVFIVIYKIWKSFT